MHCFPRFFHTLKRTGHFKSFDKKYPLCCRKKKRKKKKKTIQIHREDWVAVDVEGYIWKTVRILVTAVLCDWVSRYKTVNKITLQCQQGDRYYADLQSYWHWPPHPFSHLRAELVQGKKKGLCLHVEDSFSTSILHEMLIWKTLP